MAVDSLSGMLANQERWEIRFGAINGTICLIEHFFGQKKPEIQGEDESQSDKIMENEEEYKGILHDFLWNFLLSKAYPQLIVDEEFRVRNQSAFLIGAILKTDPEREGSQHFDTLKDMLIQNIVDTFNRDSSGDASGTLSGKKVQIRPLAQPDSETGKTMHDSEGWKSLETSMRNL